VSADAVTALYDKGVLTVRVAGAYAGAQPQRIAIANNQTRAHRPEATKQLGFRAFSSSNF
jgi:hypothetical protein